MKLKNILYYIAITVFFTSQLWAQNTNPVVTNVAFSISGTTVTVSYDVADAEQTTVTISMKVSSDGGTSWDYYFGNATGDIGSGISVSSVATSKTIYWTYTGVENNNFKIMIAADDGQIGGSDCGTVFYESITYNTILIGNQCWLKENLDVGTQVLGSVDQTNNGTTEKYCYNDDPANCTTYGGLYQWAEAVQYQNGATNTTVTSPPLTGNVQGICPAGWHIPTNAEYLTLATTVGNNSNALKAVGQGIPGGAGTNTSGFSALLSGYRYVNGNFFSLGHYPDFWSSTEYSATYAYVMYLYYNDSNIYFYYDYKTNGFSVRCVKD